MSVELAVAVVGAIGTVVSAWLISRVNAVKKEVDGHTRRLEDKITTLEAELRRQKIYHDNHSGNSVDTRPGR